MAVEGILRNDFWSDVRDAKSYQGIHRSGLSEDMQDEDQNRLSRR